jgi:hypothetical protein
VHPLSLGTRCACASTWRALRVGRRAEVVGFAPPSRRLKLRAFDVCLHRHVPLVLVYAVVACSCSAGRGSSSAPNSGLMNQRWVGQRGVCGTRHAGSGAYDAWESCTWLLSHAQIRCAQIKDAGGARFAAHTSRDWRLVPPTVSAAFHAAASIATDATRGTGPVFPVLRSCSAPCILPNGIRPPRRQASEITAACARSLWLS